jgi:hypothetical protein
LVTVVGGNEPAQGLCTFLCADCGVEVRIDYFAPHFGLCEACEEKIRMSGCSWPGKGQDGGEREH